MIRAVALATLLAAAPALAKTIDVSPGPGALQAAIDAASAGDTLRLAGGTFSEHVVVSKRLRIVAADIVVIDGGCAAWATVTVAADGVTIRDVGVSGGQFYEIDVENRDRAIIDGVALVDTCGSAEYGVNVFQSDHVRVTRAYSSGFRDAGIYIGGIAEGARVKVARNQSHGGFRGIIVEDSVASVKVKDNQVLDATDTGIFLHNSDGILVRRNQVANGASYGIHVDATSDDNRIIRNEVSGSPADVRDDGTGNCWKANTYATGSVPSTGCP